MKSRSRIRAVMKQNLTSPAFRERLMLAVTAVNGCRYCSHVHAREALLGRAFYPTSTSSTSDKMSRCRSASFASGFPRRRCHWYSPPSTTIGSTTASPRNHHESSRGWAEKRSRLKRINVTAIHTVRKLGMASPERSSCSPVVRSLVNG
ncbi:MAG: carboxymuconolactone decarboxylase family protein [Anaerolineae bacterium]|nr:carboxymuconolactone decarboxylase family protein [Anaerolineae bacterium]